MTRTKRLLFRVVAATMTIVLGVTYILALDVYLHRRADIPVSIFGVTAVPRSLPRSAEQRLVVLGGTTAFGYDLRPPH